jgi:UDP-N-acetylmuramoyl-tripeptide--D-alanyl-D-alanine ligase
MRHFFKIMKTELLYGLFKESKGIATDSRTIKKDQIFFALWGQNYNGNKYAAEAIDKGASFAVIDDPVYETEKTILVDDCLFELQALAGHYRKELNASVLAITGTNGKTTTKELTAAIMTKKYKVHYTRGNFNNEIGLPLTILSAPADTEMMILEMGASHLREIRTLCSIARPDYGIVTNVSTAHIEGFGSLDGVLKAKTELYEYLRKVNGIAIYNDKNPLLTEMIFKFVNRAVPYSDPTGIELVVEALSSDLNLVVRVKYQNRIHIIETRLFGAYNLENVKAAIAAGLFLEVEMDDIADALKDYVPGNNRSQVVKTTQGNTLICDSYNANPISMKVAVKSFSELKADRRILILGDMLELGEKSEEEHIKLLNDVRLVKPDDVLLVGPHFQKASSGSGFKSFPDVNSLMDFLKTEPLKGSLILIKGSRGMTLERVYDIL